MACVCPRQTHFIFHHQESNDSLGCSLRVFTSGGYITAKQTFSVLFYDYDLLSSSFAPIAALRRTKTTGWRSSKGECLVVVLGLCWELIAHLGNPTFPEGKVWFGWSGGDASRGQLNMSKQSEQVGINRLWQKIWDDFIRYETLMNKVQLINALHLQLRSIIKCLLFHCFQHFFISTPSLFIFPQPNNRRKGEGWP